MERKRQISQTYRSARFDIEHSGLPMTYEFWEDDQAVRVEVEMGKYKNQGWAVGWSHAIPLVKQHKNAVSEVGGKMLVILDGTESICGIHQDYIKEIDEEHI